MIRPLLIVAQSSANGLPSRTGRGIADWADTPAKLALLWIVGAGLLAGVVVLLVKMKMDKD